MKARAAVVLVTIWALTVAGVALVTWQVIHTAGSGVLNDSPAAAPAPSSLASPTTTPTPSPSPDSVWRPGHPQATGTSAPSTPSTPSEAPSSAGPSSSATSHPTSAPSHPATSHGPSHSASAGSGPGSSSGGHDDTPSATPTPTAPPAPPGSVDSWRGQAGIVTVSCEPSRIRLLGATPADGYRLEVEQEEHEVQVHFQREDPEDEVQVVARCTDGVPRFEVEQGDRSQGVRPSEALTSDDGTTDTGRP